MNRNPGCK